MTGPADGPVVAQLLSYLDSAAGNIRPWATRSEPMVLSYEVPPDQWKDILDGTALSQEVRASTDTVLTMVEAADGKVGRALLVELSGRATRSDRTDDDLVALWFATMCWGAGPRRNFRLRQWTRALTSEVLCDRLRDSQDHLVGGRFAGAYRSSKLPGVGESYLTKWLWALGLSGPPSTPRPYVLDARVWRTLRVLGWSPPGKNPADRWVEYCSALERWAADLCQARPEWHVDGERVEQLLFDRDDDCLLMVLTAED